MGPTRIGKKKKNNNNNYYNSDGMANDERGYIVVETIGAFVPFVFLIASILYLVNVVTLQARVHYALTQAANTLSMYSYVLEVTGIADGFGMLDKQASKVRKDVNDVKTDINGVLDGIESLSIDDTIRYAGDLLDHTTDITERIADDPKAFIQLLLNLGLDEGRNWVFGQLVRPLVGRYLSNGSMSGDAYLQNANVINTTRKTRGLAALDFYEFTLLDLSKVGEDNSVLIDQYGDITLVARYEVEYMFGALPLPFRPSLKISQMVKTRAWLGGRGDRYNWQ